MIERKGAGLCVTGPMLIANASALLKAGRVLLRSGVAGTVDFDLAAVTETDSSALSVIFGLLRTARESGVALCVVNPPASMVSQAALYGVSDFLALA